MRKRRKNTKQGVLLLCNSPWRAVYSPWRVPTGKIWPQLASNSLWRVVTVPNNYALGKNSIFTQKTPILTPQCPNWFPKFVQKFINIKRHSKPYETWIKNIIPTQITNSSIFHKTIKNNSNFIAIFIIMNIHSMNSQQQHLIITTTPIDHEFIKESTTTTSYITNFEQNIKFSWIYNLSMQFHHQQHKYQQISIPKHSRARIFNN